MKRILTMIVIGAICLLTLSATPQSKPVQWEYKLVYQCDEKKMNSVASEGWELVNFGYASFGTIGAGACAFKRPKG